MRRSTFALPVVVLAAVMLLAAGCGHSPPPSHEPTVTLVEADSVQFHALRHLSRGYRLATSDVFDVDFLFEKSLSTRVRVRPDGYVALPVVGEVPAAGRTPAELDSLLTAAYATYYRNPEVTVNVIDFAPETVYVLGEVRNAKSVQLRAGMTILQALAEAGGPLQTGNLGSVVLMRRVDDERAYAQRIDLGEMLSGNLNAFDMYLQPYDIVYVPKTFIARINQFVEQFFENMIWAPVFYLRTWEAFHTGDVYSIGNVARGGASQ